MDAELRGIAERLGRVIRTGLDTPAPRRSVLEPGEARLGLRSAFAGSYDWHSCLLGHWALLTMARTLDDPALGAWVVARLSPEALARERALVADLEAETQPTFPYDHGWLVLVLAERERCLPEPGADARALRLAAEARVLAWAEASPFPETGGRPVRRVRSERPFVGSYRSWLCGWLQLASSSPVGPGVGARLEALWRQRVRPQRERLAAHRDPHPYDFLWMPAVLAWAEELAGEPRRPWTPLPLGPLPGPVEQATVHPVGVAAGQLWELGLATHAGDARAEPLFREGLARLVDREDLWAEDFPSASHWVPQYLWLAIWLAAGRP